VITAGTGTSAITLWSSKTANTTNPIAAYASVQDDGRLCVIESATGVARGCSLPPQGSIQQVELLAKVVIAVNDGCNTHNLAVFCMYLNMRTVL
jgi:hypothetical protein